MRPSASLHPSFVQRPTRVRRLTTIGLGGAAGTAVVGGLAALLATSAFAAPADTTPLASTERVSNVGSLAGGVAARADAGLAAHVAAEQAAAAYAAAVQAAQAQAAQQAAARAAAAKAAAAKAAAAKQAAATSSGRATGGSFSGEASWYGPGFAGHTTSSGEPYDPNALTAASKTLPLGSHLSVCFHGRCVTVTINDRGPYVAGRILDLSEAAAEDIGLASAGVGWVTATPVS